MRKKQSIKSSLIIVFVMLFLFNAISIAGAVQLPLKQGGTNSTADVKLLQQSLNAYESYNLEIDGIFGSATNNAVRNFQSSNSLTVDGIVGTQTWSKLSSVVSNTMAVQLPLKQGGTNSTADVKLLQQSLNGYKSYDLAVDGIFGPATNSAVRDFQSSNSLIVDGIVGTQTWSKLSSVVGVYTINAAAGSGGKISPTSSQQVLKGNSITFTIIPSSGYKVQDIKVDGASVGARTTYTFSNVTAHHSISATFISVTPGSNDASNFWKNRSTWLQPVKGLQTADPTGGARYFGAPRANGRAHAAIDLIAPNGTLVYAMTDGKVMRTSVFFQNTSAVEVQNTDGTVARYGEIAPAVSVGAMVHRGDVIGRIITNNSGSSMLHLEMYMGTASGSLSQTNNSSNYSYVTVRNYQRRADLIDPTGAKDLPIK